jgi:demethylmenaquinone methyltransferase/2-methoxy-6-polyprenyl-1,4-benzoquinol methylase
VVLEFSMPRGWLGVLYRFYFRHALPRIGALVSGDGGAYAYLPASVERFARPDAFRALMAQAGFTSIQDRRLSAGIAYLYRGEREA